MRLKRSSERSFGEAFVDDAKLVRVEAAEEVVRVERARVEANRGGDHDRELLSKSWCPFAANVEEQLLGLVERRCPHRRGVAHMVEAELTPVGEARQPSLLTDYFVLGGGLARDRLGQIRFDKGLPRLPILRFAERSCCGMLEGSATAEMRRGVGNLRAMRAFRPGETVELRSAPEILATLDENGSLDGMPFMPEMLPFLGETFTVARRVEKICNTVDDTSSAARRMHSTVHLDDLHCDGSAHGGCQLGCRLYWKEEWLRRPGEREAGEDDQTEMARLAAAAQRATRATRDSEGDRVERYRCQATEAVAASQRLHKFDPRQFVREVRSGNVRLSHLVRVIMRNVARKALRVARLRRMLPMTIPTDAPAIISCQPLGLQSGDLVRVRARHEVAVTLNDDGRNRGLSFAPEMLPYCGGTYRVRSRVENFIDEKTGKMIELSTDSLILDGVTCRGEDGCWAYLFCGRGTYPFWREAWLRRVEEDDRAG